MEAFGFEQAVRDILSNGPINPISVSERALNLRKRFFSAAEIDGLFSNEDIYQNYTLDRMQILEAFEKSPSISAAEKKRFLRS
jgi:lipase chaperone LimK